MGSIRSSADFRTPFMSHSTRAVWPSFEICPSIDGSSGERTFLIDLNGVIDFKTSFTVARNAGSLIVAVLLWITTISVSAPVCLKPASLRIWSPRWAWPTLAFCSSMFFVPAAVPMKTAAMTKASQPKTAVFQWLALQRPIRAARLFERLRGDIWSPWLGLSCGSCSLACRTRSDDGAAWCLRSAGARTAARGATHPCVDKAERRFQVDARASPTRIKGGVSPATLAVDATRKTPTCLCRFRADFGARRAGRDSVERAEVLQHGEHAAVVLVTRGQPQLLEDARHVLLHG